MSKRLKTAASEAAQPQDATENGFGYGLSRATTGLTKLRRRQSTFTDARTEVCLDKGGVIKSIRKRRRTMAIHLMRGGKNETSAGGNAVSPFENAHLRAGSGRIFFERATEWLRLERGRRYGTALSCTGDAVITTDSRARITFMNPAAEALTGWTHEDAGGRPLAEVYRIFDEETREIAESPDARVLRLGETVRLGNSRMLRGLDGRETLIVDGGAPIKNGSGRIDGAAVVFRDVTQRRREQVALLETRAALAHICRVSTLGELAASIAHEVNQPLVGVVTNGKACLRWLAKVMGDSAALEEIRGAITRIIRDGKRAGTIVAKTRALSRKTRVTKCELNINETIQCVIGIMGSELSRHRIKLALSLAPELPLVLADETQMQQVLINLILNAIEAIGANEGRRREIVIRTRNPECDRVCIEVQDSGIGLAPEHTEKIFEAFHTTKPNGMGMGLSISRSIVEDHGGKLCTLTQEGHGAIFQFTLSTYGYQTSESPSGQLSPKTCHE